MSDLSHSICDDGRDVPNAMEPHWTTRAKLRDTPQDVLREHLAQTQKATRFILTFLYSEHTNLSQGIEAAKLATRLMDVSLRLADALNDGEPREAVHRMIFEHRPAPAMLDAAHAAPAALASEAPGDAQAKTIRCDAAVARYEIE